MSNELGKRGLVEAIISDYHTTRVGHDYVSHILSKRRTNQAFVSFEQDIIDRPALDAKNLRALAKTLESWANCGFQDEDYPEAIELFSQAAAAIRAAIKDATDAI